MLLTFHVHKCEYFFGERALKNEKETKYQKSLASCGKKVLMCNCAKFGCFPAIPF